MSPWLQHGLLALTLDWRVGRLLPNSELIVRLACGLGMGGPVSTLTYMIGYDPTISTLNVINRIHAPAAPAHPRRHSQATLLTMVGAGRCAGLCIELHHRQGGPWPR